MLFVLFVLVLLVLLVLSVLVLLVLVMALLLLLVLLVSATAEGSQELLDVAAGLLKIVGFRVLLFRLLCASAPLPGCLRPSLPGPCSLRLSLFLCCFSLVAEQAAESKAGGTPCNGVNTNRLQNAMRCM